MAVKTSEKVAERDHRERVKEAKQKRADHKSELAESLAPKSAVTGTGKCEINAAAAMLPISGTSKGDDANGTGTCPNCGTHAKLTAKGFMAAHRILNTSVPVVKAALTEKATKVVAGTTAVADAERKREAESFTVTVTGKGKNKVTTRTPVVAPAGKQGTTDTKQMLPGMPTHKSRARNSQVVFERLDSAIKKAEIESTVGGRYGYLMPEEFAKLGRSAQRRYWREVSSRKNKADSLRAA